MDIWFKPSTARSLRLLTMYLIECPGQGCPNRFQSCKGAREPVLSSNIIYMSLRDWTTLLRQHSHSYSLSAHQNTTGKRLNWSIEKSKLTRCRNDIQGLAGRDNTIWNQIGGRVKCGRGPHFGPALRSRIPTNTGSRSRIFCPTPDVQSDHFYITLLNWGFLLNCTISFETFVETNISYCAPRFPLILPAKFHSLYVKAVVLNLSTHSYPLSFR